MGNGIRSYRELVDQSIQGVYEKGIATKILQHMGRIRNASDITQARRWVMELLQNAQDLAWEDRPVKVRITRQPDRLIFEHTGRPFRVKDILAIINQVSSKQPGESVGQFGTGFITTYQLSEQVEINSVLKEDGLPYREFHVTLDRRGKTHEELHEAIEENMRQLSLADDEKVIEEYDRDDFHTAFTYHLENERCKEIAKIGMEDLKNTILYVLLFARGIGSVELLFEDGRRVLYEKSDTLPLAGSGAGTIFQTLIKESGEKHYLHHMEDEGLMIAAEYDQEKGFLPISKKTARIFIDFPLIGAEEFPFPVVVNSREFRPNEPRSGITLVDLVQSEDARVNKALMDRAVGMYGKFLRLSLEQAKNKERHDGIRHILYLPAYHQNPEWSEAWVQLHIYDALYGIISAEELFDTCEGKKSLNCSQLMLIKADKAEEREKMIGLCEEVEGILVPRGEVDWYAALSSFRQIGSRNLSLVQLLKNAIQYSTEGKLKQDTLAFCQRLYALGMSNTAAEKLIRSGEAAVFPNQNLEKGDKKLYTTAELYRDPALPEVLKDVSEELDRLDGSNSIKAGSPLKIREKLLHRDFKTEGLEQMRVYPAAELTDYIAYRSRREFPVRNFQYYSNIYLDAWKKAWLKMLGCGPDEKLFALCGRYFEELQTSSGENAGGEGLITYAPLEENSFGSSLWKPSCVGLLELIFDALEGMGSLERLPEKLDTEWMTELFNRALNYVEVFHMTQKKMFPNQRGSFCMASELSVDMIEAQELKQITESLIEQDKDCDVLSILLDKGISPEPRWSFRQMKDSDAASRISRAIQRVMAAGNLNDAPDAVQEACTALLAWLQDNPEKARLYFPDFSTEEQQTRLMTSRAVVSLQRKSRGLDRLMKLSGTEDLDEVEELLRMGMAALQQGKSAKSSGGYDEEYGVFFGSEFDELSDQERRDILREIGESGEKYALECELKELAENGFTLQKEQEGRYLFQKDGQYALVHQPDTESYHQQGWDIQLVYFASDKGLDGTEEVQDPEACAALKAELLSLLPEAEKVSCKKQVFIEVKTHTTTSKMRGLVPLSDSQMQLAMKEKENFRVHLVDVEWSSRTPVHMKKLPDLGRQIADGHLRCADGRYLLRVAA